MHETTISATSYMRIEVVIKMTFVFSHIQIIHLTPPRAYSSSYLHVGIPFLPTTELERLILLGLIVACQWHAHKTEKPELTLSHHFQIYAGFAHTYLIDDYRR